MSFDFSVLTPYWPDILRGLYLTIRICVVALLPSLALGLIVALARLSKGVLRVVASSYVEVFRNTPILIQAFFAYYVLPFYGLRLGSMNAGLLTLILYTAAYFSEIIRGAILAVPKGQFEAARALGMPFSLALRRIILPQTTGYLIPPLTNQTVSMVKESSILSFLTVPELTLAGQRVMSYTFSPIEAYTVVTVLYWILNAIVVKVMHSLEVHSTRYRSNVVVTGKQQ